LSIEIADLVQFYLLKPLLEPEALLPLPQSSVLLVGLALWLRL